LKAPHFEMGITRAEFLRLLPAAVGHAPWRIEGGDIVAKGPPPAWRIRMEEKPGRRFGPVCVPVLAVTLGLEALGDEEARAFVERFLRAFQRAGG
jgi:hypothetical protein